MRTIRPSQREPRPSLLNAPMRSRCPARITSCASPIRNGLANNFVRKMIAVLLDSDSIILAQSRQSPTTCTHAIQADDAVVRAGTRQRKQHCRSQVNSGGKGSHLRVSSSLPRERIILTSNQQLRFTSTMGRPNTRRESQGPDLRQGARRGPQLPSPARPHRFRRRG